MEVGYFVEAVVIAGDGARADVALRSDFFASPRYERCIAFGAFADGAFLEFDKIADGARRLSNDCSGEARAKRANDYAVIEATLGDHAMRLDGDVVAKDGVGQDASCSNGAARAPIFCFAEQLNHGFR